MKNADNADAPTAQRPVALAFGELLPQPLCGRKMRWRIGVESGGEDRIENRCGGVGAEVFQGGCAVEKIGLLSDSLQNQ